MRRHVPPYDCRSSLDSLKAAATDCFTAQAGFVPNEAEADLIAADELRALFLPLARGRASALSEGAPPPATRRVVAAKSAPSRLLQLPAEVIVLVFGRLVAKPGARRHVLRLQNTACESTE